MTAGDRVRITKGGNKGVVGTIKKCSADYDKSDPLWLVAIEDNVFLLPVFQSNLEKVVDDAQE